MPPKEKIPEALTAVIDNRVVIDGNKAKVKNSDLTKEYTIVWKNNLFYSNDNSTYWAGYIGYPIIAVLFIEGKLLFDENIAKVFSHINWNELNKKNKRDYKKSVEDIVSSLNDKEKIYDYIDKVYKELETLNIKLTRRVSEL